MAWRKIPGDRDFSFWRVEVPLSIVDRSELWNVTLQKGWTETMGRFGKLLFKVLRGVSDSDVSFNDLVGLLKRLGFEERIKGGHHVSIMEGISEILNPQPKVKQAKTYQVKQFRGVILKYGLGKYIQ
ncbi:MAG: hypothetical protein ACLFTV_19300 [Desulfococcaceae bacterium]